MLTHTMRISLLLAYLAMAVVSTTAQEAIDAHRDNSRTLLRGRRFPFSNHQDCESITCPTLSCPEGSEPVPPRFGRCCPRRCQRPRPTTSDATPSPTPPITLAQNEATCSEEEINACDMMPMCAPGQTLEYQAPDHCCGICVGEASPCAMIVCALPEGCGPDEMFVPEDMCCPVCPPATTIQDPCMGVRCVAPPELLPDDTCPHTGLPPVVPEGDCCPRCDIDLPPPPSSGNCTAVTCVAFPELCEDGSTPFTPDGECCPVCQCREDWMCIALAACADGSPPLTPPGGCCPSLCPPEEEPCVDAEDLPCDSPIIPDDADECPYCP